MSSVCLPALFVAVSVVGFAGTIVNVSTANGSGSISVVALATNNPANDNTASAVTTNYISLDKSFNGVGPLDIPLTVTNSNGTTEYYLNELVSNFSGAGWSAYTFELGFGLGSSFVGSGMFDFLDFDAPNRDPAPASSRFSSVNHGSNVIRFSNGTLLNGASGSFQISMDVPDRSDIPESYWTETGYTFTLRQTPEAVPDVPEPASMSLLLLGAAALAALKLRS